MRAIIIDPKSRTVNEADIDERPGAFAQLVSRSGLVEPVLLSNNHYLWVDEEGLLMPEPGPFFRIPDYFPDTTFAGVGAILSEKDGDHAPATVGVDLIRLLVTFPNVLFLGFEEVQGYQDHPLYGRIMVHSRQAKFEELK